MLSVIMPAYNEGARIAASLEATARALAGTDYEIILVDDGSTDGTAAIAAAAAAGDSRITVIETRRNEGKGHAIRLGFEHATGDLVAFLDADLDIPPGELHTLRAAMERSGADVVVGSKWHPESDTSATVTRRIVSHAYRAWVDLLFKLPIRETQTGIKLFRRAVLEKVSPRAEINRFGHDLELLVAAHRCGFRIVEASVAATLRSTRMPLARSSVNVWLDTLRVYHRASFWKWMQPGWGTKVWMVLFVVGIAAASAGAAALLVTLSVPPGMQVVFRYAALQFLGRTVRNWTLVVGGLVLVVLSLIYLNRHLMSAFAGVDTGDLAGLARRPGGGAGSGGAPEEAAQGGTIPSNRSG